MSTDTNPELDSTAQGGVSNDPNQAVKDADPASADAGDPAETRQKPPESDERRTRWRDEYFKAREREDRRDRLIEGLVAKLGQGHQPLEAGKQPDWRRDGREPKEEDFPGNYEAYLDAKVEFRARQVVAEQQRQAQTRAREAEVNQELTQFRSRLEKESAKYDDFDEVALNDDLEISDAMARAIMSSDLAADVSYYLGKNPKEASRIARLSPIAAIREIGMIESRFAADLEKKKTGAPAPVKTVSGNQPAAVDESKMSIEDWMERENKKDWERRQRR